MPRYSSAVLDALPLAGAEWEAMQRQARSSPVSRLSWAGEHATIVLPTEGRQPFTPYAYQARLLDDAAPRRLILKARQTGISNTIAIEALHKAISRPDSTELFVSRNQDAARVLVRYCQHVVNGLRAVPRMVNESQSELTFGNGSRIVSLPATPSTGRGLAATDVYLDEFAFCAYDQLIYESIIGTVSTGGAMTILSTPNGRSNMFYRLWAGLEGGDWSRHQIHWSDCPRYDEAWASRARSEMTRQAFAQEYDLDFIASGDTVFDAADLVAARGHDRPDPATCDEIITAWDIGRRQDHTVGITIGRQNDVWRELAYERLLVPYPVVQASIDARHRAMGGLTVVESNGVGDPVIENLTVPVTPFTTTAKTKTQAIQSLQLLLQQRTLTYASEQLDRELGLYAWDDRALIQDSVMAAAIAAYHVVHPLPAWGVV